MKTNELDTLIPGACIHGPVRDFNTLKTDSRSIQPGDAFIAVKGTTTDGHRFIDDAIEAGATVIICNRGEYLGREKATLVEIPDTQKALVMLLPAIYPAALKISLIGITGTSGKTTVSYLLESILQKSGSIPGVIGTINTRFKTETLPSAITTPGPAELFERLHAMKQRGAEYCIMEVSSHALDQDRTVGLRFDNAVFTNLSQDHLDYHQDMGSYFAAKKKLFCKHLAGKAIINTDDEYGQKLIPLLESPFTYGKDPTAMIRLISLENGPQGLRLELATPMGNLTIRSTLLGQANAYNIMASVATAVAIQIDSTSITEGIAALTKVPGRMEKLANPYNMNIIVDYAHKPDALEKALLSLRSIIPGKIITVFGCGGDRDKLKRPIMGRIATKLSDIAIITSDNPRTEDPQTIIDDITAGINNSACFKTEPDRAKAIMLGIRNMDKDDCLFIAGKGHEQYQIVGDRRYPFDDKACALNSLKEVFE